MSPRRHRVEQCHASGHWTEGLLSPVVRLRLERDHVPGQPDWEWVSAPSTNRHVTVRVPPSAQFGSQSRSSLTSAPRSTRGFRPASGSPIFPSAPLLGRASQRPVCSELTTPTACAQPTGTRKPPPPSAPAPPPP